MKMNILHPYTCRIYQHLFIGNETVHIHQVITTSPSLITPYVYAPKPHLPRNALNDQ